MSPSSWCAETHRVRSSAARNNSDMNPVNRLHETQGTPEPPENPDRFTYSIQVSWDRVHRRHSRPYSSFLYLTLP